MYALSVIQFPSGRWGFVGQVPEALAIESSNPELARVAKQCGMTIARAIAKRTSDIIRERVWDTKEAALAEAAALGYEVEPQRCHCFLSGHDHLCERKR
jgi:hypothetical protein